MQQVLDDPKINEALELLNSSARDRKEQLQQLISSKYSNIREAVGTASSEPNRVVNRNPWYFIGGAAVAFLVAGFFLGKSTE